MTSQYKTSKKEEEEQEEEQEQEEEEGKWFYGLPFFFQMENGPQFKWNGPDWPNKIDEITNNLDSKLC